MLLLLTLVVVLAGTSAALPAKGKNKQKLRAAKAHVASLSSTAGVPVGSGPSVHHTPGSLCAPDDAISIFNGFPRCRSRPNAKTRSIVAEWYGVPVARALQSSYEFTHLIPLELGGSDDITNIWVSKRDDARYVRFRSECLDLSKALHERRMTQAEAVHGVFAAVNSVYGLRGDERYRKPSDASGQAISKKQASKRPGKKKLRESGRQDPPLETLFAEKMSLEAADALIMIPSHNMGYRLLLLLGWIPGHPLGSNRTDTERLLEPIFAKFRHPDFKGGVGFSRNGKRKRQKSCSERPGKSPRFLREGELILANDGDASLQGDLNESEIPREGGSSDSEDSCIITPGYVSDMDLVSDDENDDQPLVGNSFETFLESSSSSSTSSSSEDSISSLR